MVQGSWFNCWIPWSTHQTVQPSPSALQTGISAGATLAGLYRAFPKLNMSKVFRRPMFRKGGQVNEGIMTGIVDRDKSC